MQTTDSTPYGSYETDVEPCTLAIVLGATFVAREFSARAKKLAKTKPEPFWRFTTLNE
jgi:pyruvate/2-oxoacid:ferredoxin oxidoreductase beta subunit